jgi:ACS family tartrate transporter-like MFS transporter
LLSYFWWIPLVRGFSGLGNLQVGFVSAVPNLVASVTMVIFTAHSDRTGERCLHIAAASGVAAVGFLGCALVKWPVFAVMFLSLAAAGLLSVHGPFWPMPSRFLTAPPPAESRWLIHWPI